MSDLFFDWVSPQDLDNAINIEKQGFPADEAATLEAFRFRQSQAGQLFLGAYSASGTGRQIVGYVCSTLSPSPSLTHESMSEHVPGTSNICIHSVCVAPDRRKQGIGLALLKEYISRLQTATKDPSTPYERILLITHEELRGFYEKAGFEWVGKSSVVHGSRPWFEMRKILANDITPGSEAVSLPPAEIQSPTQKMPEGLWEALQKSSRNKPVPKLLSSFGGGLQSVVESDPGRPGVSTNKFDLLCPRTECGSIILKRGVGTWIERASVQMEPSDHPSHPVLSALPPPPETTQWWLVGPSYMAFENIGFTRPAESIPPSASGKKLKLLACAECDLGPLGWCEEGGNEFWLACARVGYRE